jgi:hypothetical protein
MALYDVASTLSLITRLIKGEHPAGLQTATKKNLPFPAGFRWS